MCQACLRFKPLRFRPCQIYRNIPNTIQNQPDTHQVRVLHLELSFNVFQENNLLNYAPEHVTSPLKCCHLPVLLSFWPVSQAGRTVRVMNETAFSTTVKRSFGEREKEGKISQQMRRIQAEPGIGPFDLFPNNPADSPARPPRRCRVRCAAPVQFLHFRHEKKMQELLPAAAGERLYIVFPSKNRFTSVKRGIYQN